LPQTATVAALRTYVCRSSVLHQHQCALSGLRGLPFF
jgi:hypothetical protein